MVAVVTPVARDVVESGPPGLALSTSHRGWEEDQVRPETHILVIFQVRLPHIPGPALGPLGSVTTSPSFYSFGFLLSWAGDSTLTNLFLTP